jgi:hypothetical protein
LDAADKKLKVTLRKARLLCGFIIGAVIFLAVVSFLLLPGVLDSRTGPDSVPVVFGIVGMIGLAVGVFMPRWLIRSPEKRSLELSLIFYLTRSSSFEAVAVLGLMLGFLGWQWQVTAPFFAVALITMAITFPTGARLRKISGISDDSPPFTG